MFARLHATQNSRPLETETDTTRGTTGLKHRLFGNDSDDDDGVRMRPSKRQVQLFYKEGKRSQRLMDDDENDSRPRSPLRKTGSTASFFTRCQPQMTHDTSDYQDPNKHRRPRHNPPSPSGHPVATTVKRELSSIPDLHLLH